MRVLRRFYQKIFWKSADYDAAYEWHTLATAGGSEAEWPILITASASTGAKLFRIQLVERALTPDGFGNIRWQSDEVSRKVHRAASATRLMADAAGVDMAKFMTVWEVIHPKIYHEFHLLLDRLGVLEKLDEVSLRAWMARTIHGGLSFPS
jgi:hypothetical protein